MDVRAELARLVEASQRELQEAKEIMATQERRIERLQRALPKFLAVLEELSEEHDALSTPEVHATNGRHAVTVKRVNPFHPGILDYACWEVLAEAGHPMRVKDVALAVSKQLKENVKLSSIENVFYTRGVGYFEKIRPGVFQLAGE